MKWHDPYDPILTEIEDRNNDVGTQDHFQEMLNKTRSYVKHLRTAYLDSPSNVDYSNPHNRAAYLLAYYPHNIETLYHVLCKLSATNFTNIFESEKLQACFFGAGPVPEAIGWLAYLNEFAPHVQFARAYLLDLYVNDWRTGQDITRYHLAPQYWPNKKLVTVPIQFDFMNVPDFANLSSEYDVQNYDAFRASRAISNSNFFVMQNCLNDQLTLSKKLENNLLNIIRMIPSGSIFVIIDLHYDNVCKFMAQFEMTIDKSQLGSVLYSVNKGMTTYKSQIKIPSILTNLFTGQDGLIMRTKTNFYASVIQKL